jgi:hypothetical protein
MQPDLIRAVFGAPARRPLALDPLGCYSLRLFDRVTRTWQFVVVDDFVPVRTFFDTTPYYGRPRRGSAGPVSIWYCLLEKALAKLVGGYSKYEACTCLAGVCQQACVSELCFMWCWLCVLHVVSSDWRGGGGGQQSQW